MQRHGLRRESNPDPNNPTIVASIHTDCATKLPIHIAVNSKRLYIRLGGNPISH
jgi:hypothetical protein